MEHNGELSEPVLVSPKLSRPRVGRSRVNRPRLTAMLDTGTRRMVTLVSAGPGWGKTTLVSAWAAARYPAVAWLTLDRHDNDPYVFSKHALAALRSVAATTPSRPPADGDGAVADGVGGIGALSRAFGRMPAPPALVLDDFDVIDDRRLVRALTGLVRPGRGDVRLVLISRSAPALPLHRLRAAGEVCDITADDLAFTADEAADLLAGQGVTPPPEEIDLLVRRTEGWAVGLQLAAAFIAGPGGRSVADFTGDVRSVDDYLSEEVLARQPPRMLNFLMYTSVCENLSGELADALTLEDTGQRTLEELETTNQFVVRLDSRPSWFRCHHLMRDVLLHRLSVEATVMVAPLHRRAAAWYAAHDLMMEALEHAVAAEDWAHVGRLVVDVAPMILSHERDRLIRVLKQVPAGEFGNSAALVVSGALLLFHAADYAGIRARLGDAEDMLADLPDGERRPVEIAIRALRGAVSRVDGDMPAMIGDTAGQLAALAQQPLARMRATLQYRAIALNNNGVALLWMDRPEAAERFLSMGLAAAEAAGTELVRINALGHLALLEVMFGSVREAARLVRAAQDAALRGGWTHALQAVAAHHAAALVELERGRLGRAERALQEASRAHHSDPEAAQWKVSMGIAARLAMAQDRLPSARAFLTEAHRPRYPRARMPVLDRWLLAAESEADLRAARPDVVRRRYESRTGPDALTLSERNLLIRATLATHDHAAAQALLAERDSLMSETVATVEARILAALISEAGGRGLRADELMRTAIKLAAPEGIRGPFHTLSGGRLDQLLTRQSLVTGEHAAFIADLLRVVGTTGRPEATPAGIKALSDRETEVLRYLPTMLTAAEIGGELGVSVNTIKAHMRAIYRKLGAPRRRQAVAAAREHGLI